jgi:hypothetical protein
MLHKRKPPLALSDQTMNGSTFFNINFSPSRYPNPIINKTISLPRQHMKTIRVVLMPTTLYRVPSYTKARLFSATRPFSMTMREPRRFAPLKQGAEKVEGVPILKGVVFDVDGTLW